LEDILPQLAEHYEQRIPALADRITARVRTEVVELTELDAAEVWEAHRRVTVDSRAAQFRHLMRGRAVPESCPEPDLEAVRLAVHFGMSLSGVLHAYRIGHDVSMEAWLDSLDAINLEIPQREAATRAIVHFTLEYNDRLMQLVSSEYEAENNRVLTRSDRARFRAMRDLLEGVTESAPSLDYDLRLEHIGLVLWGDGADAVMQSLASELDARLLSAPTPAGFRWAWLGSRSFGTDTLAAVRRLTPNHGTSLALGQPAIGVEGFRRTHRQAGAAHVVATRRPQPLTLYEDVALEALALRDELSAREFAADALRGINGDDARSAGLRDTLSAYFKAGQNASSTAAALRVHEATIARRLSEVEKRTGQRVNQRRAELETALRLRRLLD
jgi:DNA-binding PucR family transcriptional regulator